MPPRRWPSARRGLPARTARSSGCPRSRRICRPTRRRSARTRRTSSSSSPRGRPGRARRCASLPSARSRSSASPHPPRREGQACRDGGGAIATTDTRRGGPPYFFVAEVESPKAGLYDAAFTQRACEAGKGVATKRLTVVSFKPGPPAAPKETDGLWPIQRSWNRNLENVYSAWIEQLFDAPDGEMPSWPALHEVLRDRKRNLLFDHLAGGEDSNNAPVVRPDCADLPYFLRAYFAFKLRLRSGSRSAIAAAGATCRRASRASCSRTRSRPRGSTRRRRP